MFYLLLSCPLLFLFLLEWSRRLKSKRSNTSNLDRFVNLYVKFDHEHLIHSLWFLPANFCVQLLSFKTDFLTIIFEYDKRYDASQCNDDSQNKQNSKGSHDAFTRSSFIARITVTLCYIFHKWSFSGYAEKKKL